VLPRIPHHGFENDFHSKLVQPLSQVKGIGVLAEGSKQFRANSDDLGVHG
jgi:hypothetical protein